MSYIMHDSLVCILYVFYSVCRCIYIYTFKVQNISLYILCHVICTLHNIQCTCYIYVRNGQFKFMNAVILSIDEQKIFLRTYPISV